MGARRAGSGLWSKESQTIGEGVQRYIFHVGVHICWIPKRENGTFAHESRIGHFHILHVFRSVVHWDGAAAVSCWKQKGSGEGELKFSLVSSGSKPNPMGNKRS